MIMQMPMQYVFRYSIKPDRCGEYQQWLEANTNGGTQNAGWTYLGTWFDLMGFGQYDYESRWELNALGSVNTRPLSEETEQHLPDRLAFVQGGEVLLMRTL
jgi:hypothetical protein